MNELQTMNAREAMQVMRDSVTRELDDLHRERRDHLDVIKSQERQLKMMRENVEYANERMRHGMENEYVSTLFMIAGWITAMVAIGYAVWIG